MQRFLTTHSHFPLPCLTFFILYITYCLPNYYLYCQVSIFLLLQYELHNRVDLIFSLLFTQSLEQCLAHRWCSVNFVEWMESTKARLRFSLGTFSRRMRDIEKNSDAFSCGYWFSKNGIRFNLFIRSRNEMWLVNAKLVSDGWAGLIISCSLSLGFGYVVCPTAIWFSLCLTDLCPWRLSSGVTVWGCEWLVCNWNQISSF